MARLPKKTDNEIVAEWLIEHRWRNSLNTDTKQKMPAFVEDAVMAAVYITGTSNGQVNISPKLVFKCLMLNEISAESVATREGLQMSDRHARRLAQTVRFALDGIRHRIQEYENSITEEEKEKIKLEKDFIRAYYQGSRSPLHSPPMRELPSEILQVEVRWEIS